MDEHDRQLTFQKNKKGYQKLRQPRNEGKKCGVVCIRPKDKKGRDKRGGLEMCMWKGHTIAAKDMLNQKLPKTPIEPAIPEASQSLSRTEVHRMYKQEGDK